MNTLLQPGLQEESAASVSRQPLLFKALAIGLGVLVLHSLVLWWALTPSSQNGNPDSRLAQLRLQRGAELPEQPQGDLFVEGRERQDEELAELPPESASDEQAGDYVLLAVLTIGEYYYALFDNGAEQQKLKLGDTLPGNGVITHIDRRQVTVTDLAAEQAQREYVLFPVLRPNTEPETEDAT